MTQRHGIRASTLVLRCWHVHGQLPAVSPRPAAIRFWQAYVFGAAGCRLAVRGILVRSVELGSCELDQDILCQPDLNACQTQAHPVEHNAMCMIL